MNRPFGPYGAVYQIAYGIYQLLLLNLLWLVFSLPIFTMGASTTALFFVTGRLVRKERCPSLLAEFWESFKLNFKQATVIFGLLALGLFISIFNLSNIRAFGSLAAVLYPVNFLFLLLLAAVSLVVFPILAKYHLTVKDCLKASVYFVLRHRLTTLAALMAVPGLYILLSLNLGFYAVLMSAYAFWVSYVTRDKIDALQSLS